MQKIDTNWILPSPSEPADALTMSESHASGMERLPSSDGSLARLLLGMALIPLMLLAAITTLCYLTAIDPATTHLFYSAEGNPFPYRESIVATTIYNYGPFPAVVFGSLSGVAFLGSFVFARLHTWRKGALFCLLAIVIGPGILINSVLKPYWGRPRPCDTVAFGGGQDYVPPGTIGPYEMAKSFPSGHASMGFVFLLPAFLLLRQNRKLAAGVFVLGLACGMGVGASRIAEGGHYLSDIAWSGAIVYFTGLTLYVVMYGWKPPVRQRSENPDTVPFSSVRDAASTGNTRTTSAA